MLKTGLALLLALAIVHSAIADESNMDALEDVVNNLQRADRDLGPIGSDEKPPNLRDVHRLMAELCNMTEAFEKDARMNMSDIQRIKIAANLLHKYVTGCKLRVDAKMELVPMESNINMCLGKISDILDSMWKLLRKKIKPKPKKVKKLLKKLNQLKMMLKDKNMELYMAIPEVCRMRGEEMNIMIMWGFQSMAYESRCLDFGGNITFKWDDGFHNVNGFEGVTKHTFETCEGIQNTMGFAGPQMVVKHGCPHGPNFFVCGVRDHCMNHFMKIRVDALSTVMPTVMPTVMSTMPPDGMSTHKMGPY